MTAQRDCLNYAAKLLNDLPGVAVEFGLGNGRTYDHLRQILPDREIFVFDRRVASFPSCTPPSDHIFLGEILHTLKDAEKLLLKKVAFVHNDLGTSNQLKYEKLIASIGDLLEPLVLPGAVIVSNARLNVKFCHTIPEPPGIKKGRYFMYRVF